MDLYIIERPNSAPIFVGTQEKAKAEAKSNGGNWGAAVIPDRKADLIEWLNAFSAARCQPAKSATAVRLQPATPTEPIPPALERWGAIATLASMDSGPRVNEIVEIICNSGRYELARYAGAVAMAFGRIEEKGTPHG